MPKGESLLICILFYFFSITNTCIPLNGSMKVRDLQLWRLSSPDFLSGEKGIHFHGTAPLFIVVSQSTTLCKITNIPLEPIHRD